MSESRNTKRILIAAGGTGGHIIPAISIAKEFIKKNHNVLFVGNKNSMEEESCNRVSIPFKGIDVQKFYRKFTFAHFKFPFKLMKSILDSKKIIKEFRPDAFLGTGGFVSGPVGYAAHLKKVPIFLQEQNSYPGATTRILSKYARKIFLGNEGAEKYLPKGKTLFSGNPINSNVIEEKSQIDFEKFGLKKESIKLFLLGGSQGSLVLNKALYPILDDLISSNIEIIWQIGKFSYKEFSEKIKKKTGIYAFDFTNEIGKIYNSVDFVIARAGALTLAELETKKIPSILVPLPSAAENHQYYNAMELKNKKVAEIIEQKDLNPEVLKAKIFKMMEKYLEMRMNFGESKHTDSANIIAEEIQNNLEVKFKLKKEIILNLINEYKNSGKKYFSLKKLKEDLYKQEPDFNSETLKKNLYRLKKREFIFSAGRGWYSFLPNAFKLDTAPIRNIINLLKREFPLLEFNVWSTEQLLPYFHHIPTRFFVFVYSYRDYLSTIFEHLTEKGKAVYLDPTKKEAEKIFNVDRETIILRPSITEEPIENNHSTIEKILVDVYIEKDNLQFLDEWEYERIFENIASRNSIHIDVIHYYIRRRVYFKGCPLYAVLDKNCV